MVRMNNIRQNENVITMDCFIDENKSEIPSFVLSFDKDTKQILSEVVIDYKSYVSRIIYKITSMLRNGEKLPVKSCLSYC